MIRGAWPDDCWRADRPEAYVAGKDSHVLSASYTACALAYERRGPVVMVFRDTRVLAGPDDLAMDVAMRWTLTDRRRRCGA